MQAGCSDEFQDPLNKLMCLLIILAAHAEKIASLLAQHAATTVDEAHVDQAMKCLIYKGLFFDIPGIEEELHDLEQHIDEDTSESGDDDIDDSDAETHPPTSIFDLPATAQPCACNTCRVAAVAVGEWDAWQPDDEILIYLKDRYESARMTHRFK